jgi:membrane-anchored protein YejM (alkaline phosphatase superfamily)
VHRPTSFRTLLRFAVGSYFVVLAICAANFFEVHWLGPATLGFAVAVWAEYAAIFLTLALLPSLLLSALARPRFGKLGAALDGPAGRAVTLGLAVVLVTSLEFLLLLDVVVHRAYGFHLNGFVWNLLLTPGGIESMDATARTRWTAVLLAGVFLLASVAIAWLARRGTGFWERFGARRPRRAALLCTIVFGLIAFGERFAFAISSFTNYRPILVAHDFMPLYVPARMAKLATRLGFERSRDEDASINTDSHTIHYPLAPLALAPQRPRWNVLWLVAESWRADTLDAEVMPETLAFAHRSLWFRNHYSGGNGTRMGVFSMFYGLYGACWFPFLNATRGPVLVDLLMDDAYQPFLYTSASFTFPEFDKTVWARVPKELLHEGDMSVHGWERDREFVGDLITQIDQRDPSRPFVGFLFFESPHAQYWFPDESIVRRPFAGELNYAITSSSDMPLVKNRYLNAVHHLDSQFARLFKYLEERDLLSSTIVVVTGDHGEEFMEKGRFGHHSDFSEEQTRVPLILSVPGVPAREMTDLSSHLDLAPTLLHALGATNPPSDYSQGIDLLGAQRRDHVVIADWDHLCVRDAVGKGIFPVNQKGFFGFEATDLEDRPIDESEWRNQGRERIAGVLRELSRFLR